MHFLAVAGPRALVVAGLACGATWLCLANGWTAEFPMALISVAIVFPIVFAINAAFGRRERALAAFASVKASLVTLVLAHRDWAPAGHDQGGIRALVARFLAEMRPYFDPTVGGEDEHRREIYVVLNEISRANESLRESGVPANEVSRANQYLRLLMADFEKMRIVREYRTPQSLRAYSAVFLNAFPVLFGPTFASISGEGPVWAGYMVAAFYSLVLVGLERVQDDLEDPFDGVGIDDVTLEVADELAEAMPLS